MPTLQSDRSGLDLLSNLPDEIEQQIEQNSYTGAIDHTGFPIIDASSSLLAGESYSPDDRIPNAGTILIDHDANGVGWFVDSTPLDNSEFTTQNTDSYLLAVIESEANGKYDLLTTVLHELAHLYGFIEGYDRFNHLVSEGWGEIVFDGSHLDKEAHPNDLMNTHLAPV